MGYQCAIYVYYNTSDSFSDAPSPPPSLSLSHTHSSHSDLYWEQHFTTMPLDTPYLEESDQFLPSYPLPEQVEKLLEMGKYENVENRVTKDNYKRRMHNLLYLEEYERRKCMSRYLDLCSLQEFPLE